MESDGSSSEGEVVFDVPNFIRVYKDGRVDRFKGTDVVPAGVDPATGVSSKDVVVDPATGVSVRLFVPSTDEKETENKKKLPVLVYFHGGGFIIETAFSPAYHASLNSVAAQAKVVAVSVDYRRAPEHPLPAAYDDSWAALQWVAAGGAGEPWLAEHGDLGRVFLAGDSAGGNIVHNLAMRAGAEGVELEGAVLIHPYFWGTAPLAKEAVDQEWRRKIEALWKLACPSSEKGMEDHRVNPAVEGAPSLAGVGCSRVLVCVAEKDFLRERGRHYYEVLRGSGWAGSAEMVETEGEDHVFHLFKPDCDKAAEMMDRLAAFINSG